MGIETALKRAELFLGLDNADLRRIAELPSSHEINVSSGEVIFRREERAQYLYVLQEGKVDLIMDVASEREQVKDSLLVDGITTGGCFGWSALVRPHLYVMSAICRQASKIVVISGPELTILLEDDNRIGYHIFQSLSHIIGTRLRDIEKLLADSKR